MDEFTQAQNDKAVLLSYSWSMSKDSVVQKWENYTGTFRITKDSIYKEIFKNNSLFKKGTFSNSDESVAKEILKYDVFFWEETEHKIKNRHDCDTIKGMQVTYRRDKLERSFWITLGCFPQQQQLFLNRLFELFRKESYILQ
jgi:hypothetical protein